MNKDCKQCGATFYVQYKSWYARKFCSPTCKARSQLNKPPWNKGKTGAQTAWNKGTKGRQPWHNITGLRPHKVGEWHPSPEALEKNRVKSLGISPGNKGKPSKLRGEKHWNWQGGKTKERERLRKSLEYKEWRTSVYKRDGYTCVSCGDKRRLEADHIKPWALYPELRFDVANGRTLCKACHMKTDTYLKSFGANQYRAALRSAVGKA